jgi:hypothetical protein
MMPFILLAIKVGMVFCLFSIFLFDPVINGERSILAKNIGSFRGYLKRKRKERETFTKKFRGLKQLDRIEYFLLKEYYISRKSLLVISFIWFSIVISFFWALFSMTWFSAFGTSPDFIFIISKFLSKFYIILIITGLVIDILNNSNVRKNIKELNKRFKL